MPELPEVETVRRGLQKYACGKTIRDVKIISPGLIKYPKAEEFVRKIKGAKIEAANRRGKYLVLPLSTGEDLVMHLKLTGQLIYEKHSQPPERYAQLIFVLDDGNDLRFLDLRKLGEIYLIPRGDYSKITGLEEMGPEPLGREFTFEAFKEIVGKHKGKIKPLLMDQSIIGGLGNAYSNEALFLSRIHPERTIKSLNEKELENLYRATQEVLQTAIEKGGEIAENFVNIEGKPGGYEMLVHGKEGQPCPNCQTPIKRLAVGGRSAFFCPRCQKI